MFDALTASISTLTRDDWSLIFGSTSLAQWLVPSVSQLYENYVLKSGEGLSITFIFIWLAGDALNMIGAIREGLLATMIILAAYYCVCDLALIWQYYHYRKYYDYYHPQSESRSATERTPLVATSTDTSAPGAVKRANPPSLALEVFQCAMGLTLTSIAGVLSWYITKKIGDRNHPIYPGHPHDGHHHHHHHGGDSPITWKWDAQISGWASAFLYLASRIPQIFKNRQTKCEGLSLALFVFSVAGNLTYCASILIKSTARDYIIENLSWLVGSFGTVFLDFIVLGQFYYYRSQRQEQLLLDA